MVKLWGPYEDDYAEKLEDGLIEDYDYISARIMIHEEGNRFRWEWHQADEDFPFAD